MSSSFKVSRGSNNAVYLGLIIVFLAVSGLLVYNVWAQCDEDDPLCRDAPVCEDAVGRAIDCPGPGPDGCEPPFIEVQRGDEVICELEPGPDESNADLGWRLATCDYALQTYQIIEGQYKGDYELRVDNCSLIPVDQDTICRDIPLVEAGNVYGEYGPVPYRMWVIMYDGPYDPKNLDWTLMQGYIAKPVSGYGNFDVKTCVADNVSMCQGVIWETRRCLLPEGFNDEVWEVSMILLCIKDVDVSIRGMAGDLMEEKCAPPEPSQADGISRVNWEKEAFSSPISYKSFRLG